MKYCKYIIILICFIRILFAQDNYEFGQSIIVNDDTPGAYFHTTTQRSIGCRGDTIYLVWRDDRYGNPLWWNSRIFFSKSTDAGATWSVNQMISQDDDTLWGFLPHLALDGSGNIYVAYTVVNDNTSNKDIFFTKSIDGGGSFLTPITVNDSVEVPHQRNCAIAVDSAGQHVYVVWQDWRNLQYEPDIYFSRSTDGGSTFLPGVRVNDDIDTTNQWFPMIACDNSGQCVYVAWMDQRDSLHGWDVYFSRSIDYGQTFEANYPINDTATTGNAFQGYPSIYNMNSVIYAVWRDRRDDYAIYFAKSIDNGLSFSPNVRVADDSNAYGIYPSIAVDDSSNIHIVWEDSRDYSTYGHEIYFAFSDDNGQTFNSNVLVNDHEGVVSAWDWDPSVCVNDSGKVFVAWSSTRNDPSLTNFDIYFAAGTYVGIQEYFTARPTIKVQCYPNPFSKLINISFGIGHPDRITHSSYGTGSAKGIKLKIYDISGRMIRYFALPTAYSLVPTVVSWCGKDQSGRSVPAGIYFVELVCGEEKYVKKVVKIGDVR